MKLAKATRIASTVSISARVAWSQTSCKGSAARALVSMIAERSCK
jgi:hypothetical protein